jgi:hypothetical protein
MLDRFLAVDAIPEDPADQTMRVDPFRRLGDADPKYAEHHSESGPVQTRSTPQSRRMNSHFWTGAAFPAEMRRNDTTRQGRQRQLRISLEEPQ